MSEKKPISRRVFMQLGSLAAVSLPVAKVVGHVGTEEIVASEEQYGEFYIKRHKKDDPPYEVDDSVYQRFDAKNNAFGRGIWDEEFIPDLYAGFRHPFEIMTEDQPGFRREDYILQNSAYLGAVAFGSDSYGSGVQRGFLDPRPMLPLNADYYGVPWETDYSNAKKTEIVKKASLFMGASLVGIAETDERWFYSGYYNDTDGSEEGRIVIEDMPAADGGYDEDGTFRIPKALNRVICLAFEMDEDAINTAASGIADATAAMGYSRMAYVSGSVAEFIRGLGYNAIPVGNQTAASVPIAIDAGLGELGRNGILITPKFGPRVRLAKIFTDMPLETDAPISFGVTEFCDVCGKCAELCPAGAISKEKRTFLPRTISNNPGVKKWPLDPEKCYKYWMEIGFLGCGQCIRTCPFNKAKGWLHEATRILIGARSGSIDKLLLNLDDASGYGQRQDPDKWWQDSDHIHIK